MHVAKLLDAFAFRPDIEVIEAFLPDVLRSGGYGRVKQTRLRRITSPSLLRQNAPRESDFDRLHHDGWIFQLRFACLAVKWPTRRTRTNPE